MELVPGKLVTTVKAPFGKRRARVVICGNMIYLQGGQVHPTQTELMPLQEPSAHLWNVATTNAKTASILLAPHLPVAAPAKTLADVKVVPESEAGLA